MTPKAYEEPGISDAKLSYIARELAMDIIDLPNILKVANVTHQEFERISKLPRFQRLLESETQAWAGALNTHERVRIKAAYSVEDWLLSAHQDMTNDREPLAARAQVAKLVSSLAGMGLAQANVEGSPGERVTVNINLGTNKLTFEKEITPKVIEGEVVEDTQ